MLPELYCGGGARAAARLRAYSLLSGRPQVHPDFLAVESEGRWLGIGEIRALTAWARYAPLCGPYRVALLGPAERLTSEAANALLKLLEDVPAHLAVLLYAEAPDRVIPTVRSRCALRLSPSPREVWEGALRRAGYNGEETDFLLDLCAEREEELEKFLDTKRDVLSEFTKARQEAEGLSLSALALQFSGEAADPLRRRAFAYTIVRKLPHAPTIRVLEAAEILSQAGTLRDFLWELLRLLRQKLEEGSFGQLPAGLADWAQRVSLAQFALEANANPRLLAEVMLLWPRKG
ncbi:MAG: hypothetical protein ACUVQS_00115 [Candidatus Bipolaricaulaceae bacterium]